MAFNLDTQCIISLHREENLDIPYEVIMRKMLNCLLIIYCDRIYLRILMNK